MTQTTTPRPPLPGGSSIGGAPARTPVSAPSPVPFAAPLAWDPVPRAQPSAAASTAAAPARNTPTTLTEHLPKERRRRRSGRLGNALLMALVVALLAGAGLLVRAGMIADEPVEAPLPAAEFDVAPGEVTGPTGTEPVAVPVDGDQTNSQTMPMTVADMGPDRLFIPALSVYMPIEASSDFVESKYAGFETIAVPADPRHGVWYSAGAPLYGGQEGHTMVASHVSARSGWGALRYLYRLEGGEMVYTTDSDGNVQSWQMTQMRVEDHTAFPQEYWSPTGERRLVVATCGGAVLSNGTFRQNVFAVAVPVDPVPKPAEQLAAEEAIAEVSRVALERHAALGVPDAAPAG